MSLRSWLRQQGKELQYHIDDGRTLRCACMKLHQPCSPALGKSAQSFSGIRNRSAMSLCNQLCWQGKDSCTIATMVGHCAQGFLHLLQSWIERRKAPYTQPSSSGPGFVTQGSSRSPHPPLLATDPEAQGLLAARLPQPPPQPYPLIRQTEAAQREKIPKDHSVGQHELPFFHPPPKHPRMGEPGVQRS